MSSITKRSVEDLRPEGGKATYLWDEKLPGFGVRANPNGRKVFVCIYRTKWGKQRWMTLGRCSDMTPDQAKERAKEVFYKVSKGEDPAKDEAERGEGKTMRELRDRHMDEHSKAYNRPKTQDEYRKLWDRVILARPDEKGELRSTAFSRKTVRDVKKADVMKIHSDMRKTPYQANAVVRLLSKAFNLAEDWGWLDRNTNPCHGVELYATEDRVAILEPTELARLGEAMDKYPNPRIALALRLYLATGCRKMEVLAAKFSDIQWERGKLRLPQTKGSGAGEEFVDLTPDLLDELRLLEPLQKKLKNPYIIPGRRKGKHLVNISKPWNWIRKKAGVPTLRIHDLRHVFGSYAHDTGKSQREVATLLRHKQLSTTERYLHAFDKKRRKASLDTAAVISGAMKKKPRQVLSEAAE